MTEEAIQNHIKYSNGEILLSNLEVAARKLEFDKVLKKISTYAVSEPARNAILKILPFSKRNVIITELQKVTEAKEVLITEGSVPLTNFKDIQIPLKKLEVENQILNASELIDILNILRLSRTLKYFLQNRLKSYPELATFHENLFTDKILEHHIDEAIDDRGFVKDSASRELKEIRDSITSVRNTLKQKLESILRHISEKDFLQEDIITTRDGRLVIPVKVEYKSKVPGFIHSASASGATVFIEPAESLELNNQLRELQIREEKEITKILQLLTREISKSFESIKLSYHTLIAIDVIFSKAKYSIEINGSAPKISTRPAIKLTDARHPILLSHMPMERVVPLSINLTPELNTIVITGPNAGGKTVALKAIGLLTICTMSGIHIPGGENSEIFIFDKIFVDIGDEQSIENDLSTFSYHLVSLKEILDNADENTLVLIDEIGAGTDPEQGGALAMAILKELTNRRTLTVATTHNSMLKVFAHENPGISNASMEYDQNSLTPTYRFRMGVPGSSYALELAQRLGLKKEILDSARRFVGEDKVKIESLIADLEKQVQEYRKELEITKSERHRLENLVNEYEQKMLHLKKEINVVKKKAIEEANEIISRAYKKIEQVVKDIREANASREIIKSSRQTLANLKQEIKALDIEIEETEPLEAGSIKIGDIVKLKNSTEHAEVVELKDNVATIVTGNLRMQVNICNLEKVNAKAITARTTNHQPFRPDLQTQLDIRGKTWSESQLNVQNFLDNAYYNGLHIVTIIHGKGSGALRKKITSFLSTYPHIKSFRLGDWNEGGEGVTIIEFM